MSSPRHHTSVRAWLVSLAVTALVLMQVLGAMHGVLHTPRTASLGRVQAFAEPVGFLKDVSSLFAGHARDGDCQLFDQLAHADLASIPAALLLAPAPTNSLVARAATPALLVHAFTSRARGPPVLA